MASIHRRARSPYWHAAWRDADGRLILRSTKQTDRKKALAFAVEAERAEKLAGAGTLTEVQARKILADILERTGGDETLRCPSVREYFTEWLASKEAANAAGTAARYKIAVSEFLERLGARADRLLSGLTARDVQRFVDGRNALGLSPATVSLDAKILRVALTKARKGGLILSNPAEAVTLRPKRSVKRKPFTAAEVKMLVDTAQGEWRTLVLLAYYTGARLSDCCAMPWDAVDFAAGTLTYTPQKTGGEPVMIPMHPELHAHLESLATSDKPERFVMPHMSGLKSGGRHGLSESFKNLMRKTGVDSQRVERDVGVRTLSRRSFHSLRHSFTSALANADVPPELRMKLTGHTTEATHKIYTHHEIETLRRAIEKLPGLQG